MGTNLLVGYTGIYQDPVTCGYLLGNGYRMYLPELMRFSVPDSWSPFGKGGIHPYAYCAGDPINHADPSGHFSELGILGVALLPLNLVPEMGEVANVVAGMIDIVAAVDETVDVTATVRGLVDTVADGGLAAASAARAASATSGAAERGAEEIGDFARAVEGLGLRGSHAPRPEPDPYAGVREDLGKVRTQLDDLEPRMTSRLHELFGAPGKVGTIRWRMEKSDRLMARQIAVRSGEKYADIMKGFEGELNAIRDQLNDLDTRGASLPYEPMERQLYGEHTVLTDRRKRLAEEWSIHARFVNEIARTDMFI